METTTKDLCNHCTYFAIAVCVPPYASSFMNNDRHCQSSRLAVWSQSCKGSGPGKVQVQPSKKCKHEGRPYKDDGNHRPWIFIIILSFVDRHFLRLRMHIFLECCIYSHFRSDTQHSIRDNKPFHAWTTSCPGAFSPSPQLTPREANT